MTTIVRAADAAQFLSLVPRMLGYRPSNSLVLVPFSGPQSLGALRVDLPAAPDPDELDGLAGVYVGMACRLPDVDALAVIVYTDDECHDGLPHADLARALAARADACGLHLPESLCVASDGWASYVDPEAPTGGRPLDELDLTPAGAELLGVAAGDQSSGCELPCVEASDRERAARALAAFDDAVRLVCGAVPGRAEAAPPSRERSGSRRRRRGVTVTDVVVPVLDDVATVPEDVVPVRNDVAAESVSSGGSEAAAEASAAPRVDPRALEAVCRLDDLPALFDEVLDWDAENLTASDAATLVWCLSRPALRDIALVGWCGGIDAGDEALDAQLRWEAGEEYPAHLAMHMWGEGRRPDADRLERALALARHAAAVAPDERRAGPLATAAWLAWALGRSTHAERYAAQACEHEPEHGLAEIVRSFVHAGHLPDWAFQ